MEHCLEMGVWDALGIQAIGRSVHHVVDTVNWFSAGGVPVVSRENYGWQNKAQFLFLLILAVYYLQIISSCGRKKISACVKKMI